MGLTVRSDPLGIAAGTSLLDLVLPDLGPPDRVLVSGDDGVVAWGTALRLDAGTGPDRFQRAAAALRDVAAGARVEDHVRVPGSGPLAIGSFAFDDGATDSVLVVPACAVVRRGGRTWRTVAGPTAAGAVPEPRRGDSPATTGDRVRFAGSTLDDVTWLGIVDEALRRIARGDVEKVVLARDQHVWARTPFDLHRLVRGLAERFPTCTTFRVDGLVGSSPEPLLRVTGTTMTSRVLAGTTARESDPAADARLGAALLASLKDRWEHDLALASVVAALAGAVADLRADPEPWLLRLANVQHLASDVTGRLAAPRPSLELLGLLHPTAAVGGTPRDAAVDLIRELEGMDRGRYAGPVGWASADGDGDWAIALRCGWFEGTRGRLLAGAGVVAGSRPEAELDETWLKLAAMRDVLTRVAAPGRA